MLHISCWLNLTLTKWTPWFCLTSYSFFSYNITIYVKNFTCHSPTYKKCKSKMALKDIWQNPLNRWFAYPKHVTFFTYSQTAVFMYEHIDITQLSFSIYPRLVLRFTTLTILRPLVPGINQCPRHMFVSFYFPISLFVWTGVMYFWIEVLNDNLVCCIVVRRCHFEKI